MAVIPYNDGVFRVIDFDSYGTKQELLDELGKIFLYPISANT